MKKLENLMPDYVYKRLEQKGEEHNVTINQLVIFAVEKEYASNR